MRPGLAQRQKPHHPGHHGSAAHVHRHLFHPPGGLDGDAATVKADALADKRDGLTGPVALPLHDHDFRGAVGPLPHAQKRAHAKGCKRRLIQHFHLDPQCGQPLKPVGKFGGCQDIGRLVHQIAGEEQRLGPDAGLVQRGLQRAGISGANRDRAHDRSVAGLAGAKVIGASEQAQQQRRRAHGRVQKHGQGDRPMAFGNRCPRLAKGRLIGAPRQLHHLHRVGLATGRESQFHRLAGLQLFKRRRGRKPAQSPLAQPVQFAGRRAKAALTGDQHGEAARQARQSIQIRGGKDGFKHCGHGIPLCPAPNFESQGANRVSRALAANLCQVAGAPKGRIGRMDRGSATPSGVPPAADIR